MRTHKENKEQASNGNSLFKKLRNAALATTTALVIACSPAAENNKIEFNRKDLDNTWWVDPNWDWWRLRWGKAYTYTKKDWTRVFWLTKNEAGFMSSQDGTYYPEEFSEIWIKPDWKTIGVYYQYHDDKITTNYKEYKDVPQKWMEPFEDNFGEGFNSKERSPDSLQINHENNEE